MSNDLVPSRSASSSFDYLLILRGICAMAVVFRHYPFELASVPGLGGVEWLLRPFGYIPVLLFFCLSGFLITQGFVLRRYDVGSPVEVMHYYRSRALRMLPLYYLSIVLCVAIYWPGPRERLWDVARLFWFTGAYKQTDVVFNHVYWTLPIEMAFFLLAPWLFLVLDAAYRRLTPLGAWLLVMVAYAAFSLGSFAGYPEQNGVVMSRVDWNRLAHQDLLYNFEVFLLGALTAMQLHHGKPLASGWRPALKLVLVLGLMAVLARTGLVGDRLFEQGRVDGFTLYLLLPLLGIWFLGFALLYARPQLRAVAWPGKAIRRVFETIGHWSYGIYLLHMPVLFLLERTGLFDSSARVLSFVALSGVLMGAALTYRFIERPLLKFRAPPRCLGETTALPG